jgi:hypothetical protein
MRSLGLFALVVCSLVACKPKEYICNVRTECVASNGGYGICADSHCAFTDNACPTGWRFDDTAGAEANLCVTSNLLQPDGGVGQADAGSADAGGADARTADSGPRADAVTADAKTHD